MRSNAYLENLLALAPMVKRTGGFGMSAGDGEVGMDDARDVAAVAAVIAADRDRHAGATYWPTGPDLIPYTDIATQLSRTLGQHRWVPARATRAAPPHDDRRRTPRTCRNFQRQAFALIAAGDAAWVTVHHHPFPRGRTHTAWAVRAILAGLAAAPEPDTTLRELHAEIAWSMTGGPAPEAGTGPYRVAHHNAASQPASRTVTGTR